MRILLRDSRTRLLFAGEDRWTSEDTEAFAFDNVTGAIDQANSHRLPEVEVLMRFSDPPLDIPLTLVGRGE